MAATVVNGPGVPVLSRNKPINLGTLTATGQVVQFTLATPHASPNGNDMVTVITTGAITTPVVALEASIDSATTWFVIPGGSQAAALAVTGQVGGDAAPTTANSYNISGIQGGLFRFGLVSGTITTNPSVWALLG